MQLFGSWREWEGWRNLKSLLKLNFFQHQIRRNGVALPFQWISKFHSLPLDLKLDISKFSNPSLTTGESDNLNHIWNLFLVIMMLSSGLDILANPVFTKLVVDWLKWFVCLSMLPPGVLALLRFVFPYYIQNCCSPIMTH